MLHLAIVGTAGRKDDSRHLNREVYDAMYMHAVNFIKSLPGYKNGLTLVSGGAAWADHLAVRIFLRNHENIKLHLHFPAQFVGEFVENQHEAAGGIANYYHRRFSAKIGEATLDQIDQALRLGALSDVTPGMFQRNAMVAREADLLLAYTFGLKEKPMKSSPYPEAPLSAHKAGLKPGGTANTWNKANKTTKCFHMPIQMLMRTMRQPE